MNRYLMLRPPDSPAAYNPASSSGMNRQQVRIHKRIANNALTQLFEGGIRTHIDAPMGLLYPPTNVYTADRLPD